MNNNKKIWIAVGVIVLVLLIIYAVKMSHNSSTPAPADQTPASTTPETTAPASSDTTSPAVDKDTAYEAALKAYQYRIQFKDCHGTISIANKGSLSLKQGSKLMLDNRDKVAHTIAFKGVSVKIAAENFAITTVNTLGTYPVTCDGGGSFSLTVQK